MEIPLATVCRVTQGASPIDDLSPAVPGVYIGVRPGPKTLVSDDELTELIRAVITSAPSPAKATARCGPISDANSSSTWARTGCCVSCAMPGCWPPSGRPSGGVPGSTTDESSPKPPTCDGAPTPPSPGPGRTAGSGSSCWSTTTPTRPGRMWPRWATASLPSSPSMTVMRPLRWPSTRCRPRDQAPPRLGQPIPSPHHFQGSLNWLGIEDDAAFVGEPQGNGVAERFIRTLKEQCLWARLCDDVDDLRQAVATFTETYNNQWLIERLGHRTPREAFNEATARVPRDSQRICPTNRGRKSSQQGRIVMPGRSGSGCIRRAHRCG